VLKALLVLLVMLDLLVILEPLAHKDLLVILAQQVLILPLLDPLAQQVLLVIQAHKDLLDHKAKLVLLAQQEPLVLQDLQVLLVSKAFKAFRV
jgi:hypothetical protein